LITHTHRDHYAYIDEYVETFPNLVTIVFKDSQDKIKCNYIKPVKHGDIVSVGQLNLEIIHTPGHYPDSICYLLEDVLFSGDTLFVGRTGRTIDKKSDTRELYNSIYNKILTLPDKTTIYPGHDYGPRSSITIKDNIKISPLLKASDENDFIKKMEEYEANRKSGQLVNKRSKNERIHQRINHRSNCKLLHCFYSLAHNKKMMTA
jgi:glyoxylase-like metal-dependent hydrolase (beta-lactamase superfamily II)